MYDQIISKKKSKICSSGQQSNMYFEKMVDATCEEKGVKFLQKIERKVYIKMGSSCEHPCRAMWDLKEDV